MMDRPDYVRRWQAKEKWYHKAGVRPIGDGEATVALMTTTEIGGFDAAAIKAKIVGALGL
jgi:hypothetical protein